MIYMVIWLRRAIDQLAKLWTNADSELRSAITKAAHQIDQELKTNPEELGESRPDGRRIHFVQPLANLYEVRQGAVRILYTWDARRKR
jgi:mRNA-degrading endonuclease RelE of RelBE toxin-antitoxin system